MNILIYIVIFTFQLGLKAFGDWWYKNKKKRIINHGLSSAIDSIIYLVASWWLFGFLAMGGVVFLSLGLRWLLYDLIYNFVNGEKYNNLGDSSKIDLWLKKQKISQYVYKSFAILIGVILITLGYYV